MKPCIVGVGEILWDVFPDGPRFGGAPANFACSAAGLGRDRVSVAMLSAVGNDQLGQDAIQALTEHHVDTSAVAQLNFPTGKVDVTLDEKGHASYTFAANTAWDNLVWSSALLPLAQSADVVCFGTLGQRSESTRIVIQRFVASVSDNTLKIFDINLRPPFYTADIIFKSLELANVLKLNEDELPLLAKLCQLDGNDTQFVMQQLAKRYHLQAVALTLGSEGALLLRGEEFSQSAGIPTNVIDTVGAGDSFTAAFALGLLNNDPLDQINHHACQVAAFVCSHPGATPEFPDTWE